MNADELKTKARERLTEIAREREALAKEERELRVMLGDAPPSPPTIWEGEALRQSQIAREALQPMVRPLPYEIHPGPSDWPPGWKVTCDLRGMTGTTTPHNACDLPDGVRLHGAQPVVPIVPETIVEHWTAQAAATNTTGCVVYPRSIHVGGERVMPDGSRIYGAAS